MINWRQCDKTVNCRTLNIDLCICLYCYSFLHSNWIFCCLLYPQVRLAILVYGLMTVLKVYVAPVTFGPVFASLCCVRGRFARDTVGRGTMAWNFSSVAPATMDSVARSCRSWYLGHRLSQLLHIQKLRWRHSWHQLPLHLVTPPPTHHLCRQPSSHCLR